MFEQNNLTIIMKTKKNMGLCLLLVLLFNSMAVQSQQINKNANASDKYGGIVGGNVALPQAYPWMTSIVMDNGAGTCGASLIKPNWVITAAHCALPFPNGAVIDKVIINSLIKNINGLEPYAELILVDSIIPHENFSLFSGGPDLALLHLSTSSITSPIQLAEYSDSIFYTGNMPAKVLGWGITAAGGSLEDSLREADCIFIEDDTCAILYSNSSSPIYGSNPGGQICAGFFSGMSQAGAAAGDSGGPLFFIDSLGNHKQVGIVSGGESSVTTEDYPGIFTLIPKHRDWIEKVISDYEIFLATDSYMEEKIEIQYISNKVFRVNGLRVETDYSISLIDITGRSILNNINSSGDTFFNIDFNNLAAGFYLVTVSDKVSNRLISKKIIIE